MQLVVSATPGTGKSTITKNAEKYGLKHCHVHFDEHTKEYELTVPSGDLVPVFDSDSSLFDKSAFPGNYIKHIKEVLSKFPNVVIFVSSHDNVREAMAEAKIDYVLAYPERELKGDYLERYKERGSPEAFIKLMDDKWNDFLDSCLDDKGATRHLILSEGEFLVDVIQDQFQEPEEQVVVSTVDPIFPTAILSGNESIGDIVCDDVGNPVAAWGETGLEPLPGNEPTADVVVQTDPLAVLAPEPVAKEKDVPEAVITPEPDFSAAIVTGNESIGDTVYSDVGTPVAVVGETGLEPIPVEVIVDVNAVPVEEPPAAMDPVDTPAPITNLPETMQSPDPVPPVEGQPAVEPPSVDGTEDHDDNSLPIPTEPLPPALQEMDKTELIESYCDIQDDVSVLEAVVEVCQGEDRGGVEGREDGSPVFIQAAEHIKGRYGKEVEPTLAGMEGFLDELKKVGTAIKRAFSDPKADSAKIKQGLYEINKVGAMYRTPGWINKQQWINVGKVDVQIPGFLKDATSTDDVKTALGLVIKRVVDAVAKHSKNDIARYRAAMKIFNETKKWDPAEKKLEDYKALLKDIPDHLGDGMADSGLKDLNMSLSKAELPAIPKSDVGKLVDLMDMLTKGVSDMYAHESKMPEMLDYEDYAKNKFFAKVHAPEVYQLISAEADEPEGAKISWAYYTKMLPVAKFLEMWLLRSTK